MTRRPSVAARLLAPVLVLAERADRRRRRIRPIRVDGLLGAELRRHDGPDLRLRDGTPVRRGDLVVDLHLRNERVRAAVRGRGWIAIADARGDLDTLQRWCGTQPLAARPVAVHARTVLGPILVRAGFERRARRQTARARLDGWFMRWLMGRYAAAGTARLARGHGSLRAHDYWLPVPREATSRGAAEREPPRGPAAPGER